VCVLSFRVSLQHGAQYTILISLDTRGTVKIKTYLTSDTVSVALSSCISGERSEKDTPLVQYAYTVHTMFPPILFHQTHTSDVYQFSSHRFNIITTPLSVLPVKYSCLFRQPRLLSECNNYATCCTRKDDGIRP
jgi:hypothetical protein